MSLELNVRALTLAAAADLSAAQYKVMQVDSTGKAALSNATSLNVGILQNNPAAGQAATVAVEGVSKILLAGTVAAGARVTSDLNALGVAAVTVGDSVIGVALAGGAAGDLIPVLIGQYPFATLA